MPVIIFLSFEMLPGAVPSVASSVCQPGLTVVLYVPCLLHTMLSLSQGLKDSKGDGSCCKYCERDVGGKWLDYPEEVAGRCGKCSPVCKTVISRAMGVWLVWSYVILIHDCCNSNKCVCVCVCQLWK